ncbi:YoaK family protein [Sphingobacterium zeae]|uniref:YoaK family protein n=1 Tax=Sphingobacterium zeae TaxID=1776859 RepID=UPI003623847F
MFRHQGRGRNYIHNLKLASILSCVAGLVNITGVLSLNTLTTNVTGHFAFFSEQLILTNYKMALIYLWYIGFFLLGASVSGFIIELASKKKSHNAYIIPICIESIILISVGLLPVFIRIKPPVLTLISFALLFAMGLQNALVTKVSKSVVRTTHLTGLFTDLGIEISQLFFYKDVGERVKLKKSIFLKLMIIAGFFIGGILGGFMFQFFKLKTLLLPAVMLFFALWYDHILLQFYHLKRSLRHDE